MWRLDQSRYIVQSEGGRPIKRSSSKDDGYKDRDDGDPLCVSKKNWRRQGIKS